MFNIFVHFSFIFFWLILLLSSLIFLNIFKSSFKNFGPSALITQFQMIGVQWWSFYSSCTPQMSSYLACEFMIPCLSATLINILPSRGSLCPQGRISMARKQSPSSPSGACVFAGRVVNEERGSVCSCFNSTKISTVKSWAMIVPR